MGRPKRLQIPGGLYHITSRGNRRQPIFQMPQDYKKFELTLASCVERHGVTLFAYCFMPNHVHLLVQAGQTPIAPFMHRLATTYSHWWNAKYEQVGHVFQGRYRDTVCDDQEYLHALIRYVHLNPVRAKLAKSAREWTWSSIHAYLLQPVPWVASERALALLGESREDALKRFVSLLESDAPPLDLTGRYLGSKSFLARVQTSTAVPEESGSSDALHRTHLPAPSFAEAMPMLCGLARLRVATVMGKKRSPTLVFMRMVIAEAMARWWGWSDREIARVMKKSPSGVAQMRRRATHHGRSIYLQLKKWEPVLRATERR